MSGATKVQGVSIDTLDFWGKNFMHWKIWGEKKNRHTLFSRMGYHIALCGQLVWVPWCCCWEQSSGRMLDSEIRSLVFYLFLKICHLNSFPPSNFPHARLLLCASDSLPIPAPNALSLPLLTVIAHLPASAPPVLVAGLPPSFIQSLSFLDLKLEP